mgnify:CR=1 FL=1
MYKFYCYECWKLYSLSKLLLPCQWILSSELSDWHLRISLNFFLRGLRNNGMSGLHFQQFLPGWMHTLSIWLLIQGGWTDLCLDLSNWVLSIGNNLCSQSCLYWLRFQYLLCESMSAWYFFCSDYYGHYNWKYLHKLFDLLCKLCFFDSMFSMHKHNCSACCKYYSFSLHDLLSGGVVQRFRSL